MEERERETEKTECEAQGGKAQKAVKQKERAAELFHRESYVREKARW